jgi:hypothetical protein
MNDDDAPGTGGGPRRAPGATRSSSTLPSLPSLPSAPSSTGPAQTPIDAIAGQPAAKGVVVGPMVAALKRALRDKGQDAAAGLLPGDLEAVRYARILATGYYALDFYHRVVVAAHEHAWGGGDAGAKQMGIDAATDALKGHYVAFLREGDPSRTLSAAPKLWAAHYRGSTCETTPLGNNGLRIHVRGYGPMPPVLQVINRSWAEACVKLTGGRDVRATANDGADGFIVEVFWTATPG